MTDEPPTVPRRELDAPKEEYLGDSLYASFDGFHFILRAPRFGMGFGMDHAVYDNVVYLEPSVLKAFNEYVKRMIDENGVGEWWCAVTHPDELDRRAELLERQAIELSLQADGLRRQAKQLREFPLLMKLDCGDDDE